MRICILTHTFPRFSGDMISSIFMSELAQSLANTGNKVWVLTPYTTLFRKSKAKYKVVTYKYIFPDSLHKLGYSETLSNDMGLPILMWLLSPFMYFFGFLALIKLIKKEKIEIVNAHWVLPNGFIASAASLFTGVPVVSTLPGSDVYMAKKNILFNVLARFATWKSNHITSNSPQLISDLEKTTQIDLSKKSQPIIYGIGSDKFKPDQRVRLVTRKEMGYKADDVVVLGVGRLVAKKGFRYLVKASESLVRKNKNIKFVLIGDGDEREFIEKEIQRLKVGANYKLLGNISYTLMNNYYNMADIFILPSIRDKGGNLDDQSVAVMDAMSCSKPVITTDFPGYRLVVKDSETGFLIKEKRVDEIAKKITDLYESKSLRENIGKRARMAILKDLSWPAIAKQYIVLFRKLI